jgi:hypothetical protein
VVVEEEEMPGEGCAREVRGREGKGREGQEGDTRVERHI